MDTLTTIFRDVERELSGYKQPLKSKTVGRVVEVKDEIVFLDGLENAQYGELLDFGKGIIGMIVDLSETLVGAIVF